MTFYSDNNKMGDASITFKFREIRQARCLCINPVTLSQNYRVTDRVAVSSKT